ncbi:(d)CMP kinase [Pelagibacteraceae bacterium]|nr:(d)CMP kinase [Pelagibacteraceae bacterium]
MKKLIITIDGPAASGKEKIAKYISKKWKLNHLDSGILYRRLALIFLIENIDIKSIHKIKNKLKEIRQISFRNSKKIRTQIISKLASKIAVHDCVRSFVNKFQYNFVNKNKKMRGFVIDGRDIGSVVFKKADLKLYIDVNSEIRAKRRYKQLIDSGEKSIYPKILRDIKLRKHSPLIIPKGSHIINNNGSFKDTVNQINILLDKI